MVDVKIIDIDYDNKKVSLSIRALLEAATSPLSPRMSTRSNHIPTMKPCCFRLETARFFSFLQIRHTK